MFTEKQFHDRASSIYDGQRDREKKRLIKALPTNVPFPFSGDEILPYSRKEFCSWLFARVGLGVIICPYCKAPIHLLTLTIDHSIPLSVGGSLGLDNQEPTCERCNLLKGELCPEEFRELLRLLDQATPHLRAYVEKCLLNGPQVRKLKQILAAQGKQRPRKPRPALSRQRR
jgi:hypothetical protein